MSGAQKENPAAATGRAQQNANSSFYNTESPTTKLLSRLDKVRETGRGQWLACCPAHDDKSPSLSVRECGDGTVLLHCFALCPASEVLAAVGLTLAEMFPDYGRHESGPKRRCERRIGPKDALAALAYEATVITVIASDIKERKACSAETYQRLAQATARIGAARDEYV